MCKIMARMGETEEFRPISKRYGWFVQKTRRINRENSLQKVTFDGGSHLPDHTTGGRCL